MMSSRKMGTECLHGSGSVPADATLLDFWRWVFGNICSNNLRGIFAEWMVAKLLALKLTVRDSWGEYDLQTPEGCRIEVKATGRVQVWAPAQSGYIQPTGCLAVSTKIVHRRSMAALSSAVSPLLV